MWVPGKHDYGWNAETRGVGEFAANYGYPSYNAYEPNVAGQWLFDESSGAIVDEVEGLSLAVTGTPTFSVTASGRYAGISPGITYGSAAAYHSVAGTQANLSPGTGDFTIEVWYKTTSTSNGIYLFDATNAATGRGYSLRLNAGSAQLRTTIKAEDDTLVDNNGTSLPATVSDGNPHKIRVKFVRSGSATVYFDEVQQGTFSLATLSGKTVNCNNMFMGVSASATSSLGGTLFEVRISMNSTNNSSSPVSQEVLTGASAAWLMDESSGSIVDEIGGVTLAQYNAANTYSVTGGGGFDPGITMNATAGGFSKSGATAAMDFGVGDGNVFVVAKINGTLAAFSEIFTTGVPEVGSDPGWAFRLQTTAGGSATFAMTATDTTAVTASWSTAAVQAAVATSTVHYWEFRVDRTAGTVKLYLDGKSQGTVSIAALAGKTISTDASSGIGLGCDYRAGISRNVPVTIYFARVKQTKT